MSKSCNQATKHWQQEGQEPDYRFSLANERTFLAWIGTALAMVAGGVLLHHLVDSDATGWVVLTMGGTLAIAGAVLGASAFYRWKGHEIAMRNGRPLPRSILIPSLAVGTLVVAVFATVKLLLS